MQLSCYRTPLVGEDMDGGGVASAGPGSTSTSATRIRDHHHPEEEEALIPEPNRINLQPKQTPPAENMYSTVSMSPRVPRKRGAGNGGNGSKEVGCILRFLNYG